MTIAAVFWPAFVLGALLVGALSRFAPVLRLVDLPGGHKHHATPVPLVGGLGIGLAVLLVAILPLHGVGVATGERYALLAALLMLCLGVWDDRVALSPRLRLVAQAIAALVLAAGGGLLQDLGALLDGRQVFALGWFAWPMTVFSVVGVMNACNMSDGMDGAAGTLAALAIIGALLLAPAAHPPLLLWMLLGATLGFLLWNLPLRHAARAYLGDAGSLLLGALLAWMLVSMSQGPARAFTPAAALWLYALPLIDTVSVMWRRLSEQRSPFQPDQRHVHHILLRAGLTVRQAWLGLTLMAGIGVMVAVTATRLAWSEPALLAGFLALAFLHHGLMRHADRSGRWLGRHLAARVAVTSHSGLLSTDAQP